MTAEKPGRVLVTGGSGLLGREVVKHVAAADIRVTVLDGKEPEALPADRVVVGSASDAEAVRSALEGVDAVIHLAALKSPHLGTAAEVFLSNTSATFIVLNSAAEAGIRRAVIASSYSILGITWSPQQLHPAYLPIDENLPLQIEDPYALSKKVDELTASLLWHRYGLSVVALRFPFIGGMADRIAERAERIARDPEFGARDFWTYLETRDAASACLQGLTEPEPGCYRIAIAAPNTLAPYPTDHLLDAYHPSVQRRKAFPGRTAPVDLTRARQLLNWEPRHLFSCAMRDLRLEEVGTRDVRSV